MKVAHTEHVKKIICPLCKKLASTKTNMTVHIKRQHKKIRRNRKLKFNVVFVPTAALINGRFRGKWSGPEYSDDSETSDDDDIPLAQLAPQQQQQQQPLQREQSENSDVMPAHELDAIPLAQQAQHHDEIVDIDPQLNYGNSSNMSVPECVGFEESDQIDIDFNDESIDPLELTVPQLKEEFFVVELPNVFDLTDLTEPTKSTDESQMEILVQTYTVHTYSPWQAMVFPGGKYF